MELKLGCIGVDQSGRGKDTTLGLERTVTCCSPVELVVEISTAVENVFTDPAVDWVEG